MIRRPVISALCFLVMAAAAYAGPARPGVHRYRQPDGSSISIRLQGDEFHHWATDPSGSLLEADSKGFYRKASAGKRVSAESSVHRSPPSFSGAYMTTGERRIPVVLIEFADVAFSFDNVSEMFDNLLNKEGYSDFDATGSVRDFFVENSHGRFIPVFDVLEPVRLEKNMSAYGANTSAGRDKAPEMALYDAFLKLDESTDFSAYDADDDGEIDMVLFYYAGYDEAESGPADAIWSHQLNVQVTGSATVRQAQFDGKRLGRYFCTSELSGGEGTSFTGIGTTCHEFAHSLGLPDFYDTDGSENGNVGGMYNFSTMGYGLYNNDGRTPPYFNMLERSLLGWVPEPGLPLPGEGALLWEPVQDDIAYIVPTTTEGEYFIWEYRNGKGWDAYIPEGLLLYHIDRSGSIPFGGKPASFWWDNWETFNNLNSYISHPLAYIIPAVSPGSMNYIGQQSGIVFPGTSEKVFFDPVSWDREGTDYQFVDIRRTDSGAFAYILVGHGTNISGLVTDMEGEPVPGATLETDISEETAISGTDGRFVLDLGNVAPGSSFVLGISAQGYRRAQVHGVLEGRSAYLPVSLIKEGESSQEILRKYDASQSTIFYPLPSRDFGDCMGAVKFTSEDLFRYVGRRISAVSFSTWGVNSPEAVYVIVDFGGNRVLTREVEEPVFGITNVTQVDISDADLRIPDGEDVFIGYGIKGSSQAYPLGVTMQGHPDNSYYGKLNLESSTWIPMESDRVSTGYMDLLLSAGVKEVSNPESVADMGYAFIDLGGKALKAGESLPLKVASSRREPLGITWLYDGEIYFDPEVTLTKGIHALQAILDYGEAGKETLRAVITCE